MRLKPRFIPSEQIDYRAYDVILSLWGKQLARETNLEERYYLALEIVDERIPTYLGFLPESEMIKNQRTEFVKCLDDACQKIIAGYWPRAKGLR